MLDLLCVVRTYSGHDASALERRELEVGVGRRRIDRVGYRLRQRRLANAAVAGTPGRVGRGKRGRDVVRRVLDVDSRGLP